MTKLIKDTYKELLLILLVMICGQVFAETRKVIVVVDTGIPRSTFINRYLCTGMQYDLTGRGIYDVHGHGTNVVGIIANKIDPKVYCISMIKWYHSMEDNIHPLVLNTVDTTGRLLMKLNPVLVNMSVAGTNFSKYEFSALAQLLANNTIVVISAGNAAQNLNNSCNIYPACYSLKHKNFHVVAASDLKVSNFGGPVTDVAAGLNQCGLSVCLSGTSQAAANMSARLLEEMQ